MGEKAGFNKQVQREEHTEAIYLPYKQHLIALLSSNHSSQSQLLDIWNLEGVSTCLSVDKQLIKASFYAI